MVKLGCEVVTKRQILPTIDFYLNDKTEMKMSEHNTLSEVLLAKEVQHIEDQMYHMEQQIHHIPLDNSAQASQIGVNLQQLRQSYKLSKRRRNAQLEIN